MRIRFDTAPDPERPWFNDPRTVIRADRPEEVAAALDAMQAARQAGLWLAGYASYELGYALEPRLAPLMPPDRDAPLLCFGTYDAPQPGGLEQGRAGLGPLARGWSFPDYREAFDRLHDWIGAGDLYQANLTFPLLAGAFGDPEALYAAMVARQAVPHGALILQEGGPAILSRSPELFFEVDRDGTITTCPMKGTQPRGATPEEDAALLALLVADPKIRAENLMIVDLLRNDLSRVARPGSVRVPRLYAPETYATVHQLVSEIRADLRDGVTIGDLFHALFPCGSITGAPKVRAMEIIRALEPTPRGVYCGSIGWFAPDGRARLNVAIRTLVVTGGVARLNVGGGIVWDSGAAEEYQEALWKARYAEMLQPEPA